MIKKGLGRGLNALLDGAASQPNIEKGIQPDTKIEENAKGSSMLVDIRKLEPNKDQPRQFFDEAALTELAESVKNFGIVQPLVVKDNGSHYTIIAGERRYRAARLAGLAEVPVVIGDYSETETLQVALLENIQRQDLTPIEEANCYKRLMDDFFFSVETIAEKLGKSKHTIIGLLHLLDLAPKTRELAAEGKLTASHAKVLLAVEDEELQFKCATTIVEEGLSVRASEVMITQALKAAEKIVVDTTKEAVPKDTAEKESTAYAYRRAEFELREILGSQVFIKPGKKSSKIEIEYYSTADLDRLMELFKAMKE